MLCQTRLLQAFAACCLLVGCAAGQSRPKSAAGEDTGCKPLPQTPETTGCRPPSQGTGVAARPAYRFAAGDVALLDEVEHAAFLYFWNEVGQPAALVRDRKKAPVSSIAAVGFQLATLPVGVERGWVSHAAARRRALSVLGALTAHRDNRKFGVFLHFPDLHTGGPSHEGYEVLYSTVDHALFLAGAITAGEYFGGEVKRVADRLVAETNWRAYAVGPGGLLSMGWKPADPHDLSGAGTFLQAHWSYASDEERLVYFLAVGAPRADHAVAPALYYRLKRPLKRHDAMSAYAVSWPGTLFTYEFSHLWIDYRSLGRDRPERFGVAAPPVDWFENSRRAVLTHRQRCIEQAGRFKTLSQDRWGLSACAGRDGYIVPRVRPNDCDVDEWFEGTVAPYAATTAIMFTPRESLAAIRAFRTLRNADGGPMVWRDPAAGGYGFVDAFNLDQGYASDDYVGIDQGPIVLAIENVRSGLVWKLFMRSETARRAVERLRLR